MAQSLQLLQNDTLTVIGNNLKSCTICSPEPLTSAPIPVMGRPIWLQKMLTWESLLEFACLADEEFSIRVGTTGAIKRHIFLCCLTKLSYVSKFFICLMNRFLIWQYKLTAVANVEYVKLLSALELPATFMVYMLLFSSHNLSTHFYMM